MYGGIEAGGTKFVCAVGTGPEHIEALARFPTTSPEKTIAQAIAFFEPYRDVLKAIGVASFGPIDPNPTSPTYGFITSTPKPGWVNTDIGGAIRRAIGKPIIFDTDVNGAVWGEYTWGAAQGLAHALYLTIGTGIGGGAIVNHERLHGLLHPEMGHVQIPRASGDTFAGCCPYHETCLGGMASGSALKARWGIAAEQLPPDHEAWDLEVYYLSMAIVNYILILSPEKIILGGGVMEQSHLFPKIRLKVQQTLNEYVDARPLRQDIDRYIVSPALGNRAGVLGSLALAMEAPVTSHFIE